MHLLLLVSDFAAVMHVQRPEDGTLSHPEVSEPAAVPAPPVGRFSWGRLVAMLRPARTRPSDSR